MREMVLVAVEAAAVGAFVLVGLYAMRDGDRATVAAAFGATVFALWLGIGSALSLLA